MDRIMTLEEWYELHWEMMQSFNRIMYPDDKTYQKWALDDWKRAMDDRTYYDNSGDWE